jgi:hypothetical protein
MKTIDDALNLRRRIFAAFELAESAPSEAERRRWLTFAVVGSGPTGCEVVGQIAELAHRTLHEDFRSIDGPPPTCSCSTPARTSSRRSAIGCRARPRAGSSAWASRSVPIRA